MIKAIIVDDERPAVDKLCRLLDESNVVDVKGAFTDPLEALAYIKNKPIDAVFLDIEMPGMDGIELSHLMLQHNQKLIIIFVTAYNEYAVEAFRINAIDYLVKPLVRVQLKETLERIMQKIGVATYSERPTIYCFGKFAVCTKQGEVRFRTQKAEELLAFFVDRRGGEISRNEIVDSIWGEFDGQKAVNHFNTTLYYMKKALLQSGAEITVERVRDRYRLDIDQFECDYIEFISFVSSAETVDKCTTTDYERAIDLYQGDYLAGNDFSWGERNRAYLKEKYIDIVLKTADYYRAAGKFGEAIDLLKTSRRYEPLHNEIYYWLIETFLFAQDKLSAVKYYNTYKNCLEKEFGLEPDEKINNLMRKVKGIS